MFTAAELVSLIVTASTTLAQMQAEGRAQTTAQEAATITDQASRQKSAEDQLDS